MAKPAPIALFVYNRPSHTQRTIEALKRNVLAAESDLIVYSDGPKDEKARDSVERIRAQCHDITGFASVKTVWRAENYGLSRSITEGVSEVVEEHGRVIVMEDDLVTSRYFLKYMNDALELYKDEQNVVSIHGYTYPIAKRMPDTYFLRGADCWGWATWARGWEIFRNDGSKLLEELEARGLLSDFDFGGTYPYSDMLRAQVDGANDSWAIRWYASAFLRDKLTLYPARSLVYNAGCDSSGTNFGSTKAYDVTLLDTPIAVEKIESTENKECRRQFSSYFRRRLIEAKWVKLKRRIYRQKARIWRAFGRAFGLESSSKPAGVTYGWFGDYSSWEAALADSTGYAVDAILEKTKNALLRVKRGESAYERDSVLFDKIEYSFPVLASLLWVATRNDGKLSVLDFGGSLGSSYFQNRPFLTHVKALKWNIVEQQKHVAVGREFFEDEILSFSDSLEKSLFTSPADVILTSSVLQYLRDPVTAISNFYETGVQYWVIDLTGFIEKENDRLTVQKVSPQIYEASYPCWFFSMSRFLERIKNKFRVITDFDCMIGRQILIDGTAAAKYRGFLLERI